jgi:hypothetical protein
VASLPGSPRAAGAEHQAAALLRRDGLRRREAAGGLRSSSPGRKIARPWSRLITVSARPAGRR